MTEASKPAERSREDKQLAEELVERARSEGVELVGPGGLLSGLTKNVLEAGLEAEMSEHLGYERHDPAGRNTGNWRNGIRLKAVLTDVGPVDIEVPRDRGLVGRVVVEVHRRHRPSGAKKRYKPAPRRNARRLGAPTGVSSSTRPTRTNRIRSALARWFAPERGGLWDRSRACPLR